VFVSGEPGTAGHIYRVARPEAAAAAAGLASLALTLDEAVADPAMLDAAVVLIWRAAWDARVAAVVQAARGYGARILFDVDDLMFEPELATFALIDGIRTQSLTEPVVQEFYARVQQTLQAADAYVSPTAFLTARMQRFGKPGFVLPNGFDEVSIRVSNAAVAARRAAGEASVLRIGYAGGTRTHQKDFATIAGAVAEVLRASANRRLVLFRRGAEPCVDVSEFPALRGLEQQVEWRQMVGLTELPWELARFDVNLAPLELGNPYCEAKSELKFFEAALVGVPTVAAPTQPFRHAIRDGENGFLATDEAAWVRAMTKLLVDSHLRRDMAGTALADVSMRYGSAKRRETVVALFQEITR
jgi:glycosyltransferase involved in cell wall biosynthesis